MALKDIVNKIVHPVQLEKTTVVEKIIEPQENSLLAKWAASLPTGKVTDDSQVVQRLNQLTFKKLKVLSDTDPVIWSIKKVRAVQVTQTKWDIVADLDAQQADLDRWEEIAIRNLNKFGFVEEFKPTVLDSATVSKIESELKSRISENVQPDEAKAQIRYLFDMMSRALKQEAEIHRLEVKRLFERPNDAQTSFEALMKIVVDDILTYDAGILVKNKNRGGDKLAEIYTLPGQEIKIVRNTDGTVPKPPETAYLYVPEGIEIDDAAKFTNDDLVYIVDNPQHSGYGMSPLEVAVFIITASLYAENYNMDFLKHSNIPPAILSLGQNVPKDKVELFQKMWDAEVNQKGGLHKLFFASGSDAMKLLPLKQLTNSDMQLMEYLKWTISIKCMAYQISPQDIGFTVDFHRSTAEVQEDLSKTRGLKNLLSLIEAYINSEIIRTSWPYRDIKFKWLDAEVNDSQESATIDSQDQHNGNLSINERRAKLGRKPIDGGDRHYVYTGTGLLDVEDLERQRQESLNPNTDEEPEEEPGSEELDENGNPKPKEQGKENENPPKGEEKPKEEKPKEEKPSETEQKFNHQHDHLHVNVGSLVYQLDKLDSAIKKILEK